MDYNESSVNEPVSYRNYFVVGGVILAVLAVWFVFAGAGSSVLTEQKCREMLSVYDSRMLDADINYKNNFAEIKMNGAVFRFYKGNDFYKGSGDIGCDAVFSPAKILKGEELVCKNIPLYSYAKEHEKFYETEVTFGNTTFVRISAKNEQSRLQFEPVANKQLCSRGE